MTYAIISIQSRMMKCIVCAPVVGDIARKALGRALLAPTLDGVVVELLEDRL